MKTLKKTLCLVLAVVMAVGVLVLPAYATDFDDDADITHDEAVSVLNGLSIVSGVGNGKFNPEGTFTRGDAAVLLTRVLLTPDGAEDLDDTRAIFDDVPVTSNYNKYITWAVEQGHIHGVGDNKFNPTKELTGVELAALMLEAIGEELPTDGSWKNFVARKSKDYKLTDNISGYSAGAVISRDDAVQMMYNAMNASPSGEKQWGVYKLDATTQKPTGNPVETFDSIVDAAVTANYLSSDDGDQYGVDAVENSDSILATLYDVSTDDDPDGFGRPQSSIVDEDGNVLYSKPIEANKSYTSSVTLKQVYADLGLSKVTNASVYVDGTKVNDVELKFNASDSVPYCGNGTKVDAYVSNGKVTIIVETENFATVTNVETKPDENGKNVTTVTFTRPDSRTFDSTDFTDLEKNDVVLFSCYKKVGDANFTIDSVVKPEVVTGTYSKKTTANGKDVYTIGDNTYELARAHDSAFDISDSLGKEVSVYVDEFGYIVGSVERTSSGAATFPNFIYVLASAEPAQDSTGTYLNPSDDENYRGKVYGILSNGDYGEYTVNYGSTQIKLNPNTAYSYTPNDAGELVTSSTSTMSNAGALSADFTGGAVSISTDGGTYAVNSNTIFMYYTSVSSSNVTIQNFSKRTGTANAGKIAQQSGYVVADANGLARVVIVKGDYTTGTQSADVAYIVLDGDVPSSVVATLSGDAYTFTYTAYTASGEEITITEEKTVTHGAGAPSATVSNSGLYYYNTNGTLGQQVQSTVNGTIEVFGDTIKVGNSYYTYNADNVCFLENDSVLTKGQTIVAISPSAGTLSHIWVTADAE